MKMKLIFILMIGALVGSGCSAPPKINEREPVGDIKAALSGGRIPEWFSQVETNMTEQQVRAIMKCQPDTVRPTMWEYIGGFAESEPHPVRDVFRIHFRDGKVTRKERTISDCIYMEPPME